MSSDSDLEVDASEKGAAKTDASANKSGIDYEKKYRGLSKLKTELDTQLAVLRSQYDALLGDNEELSGKVRTAEKDKNKALADITKERDEAVSSLATASASLAKIEGQNAVKKAIKDKFADKSDALLEMLEEGDLKTPDQFAKPEEYDTYLTRIAAKLASKTPAPKTPDAEVVEDEEENDGTPGLESPGLAPFGNLAARRQLLEGTTPNVALTRDSKSPRSRQQVEQDMWELSTHDKDYNVKYARLENEMNELMGAARKALI